jgi:hypothetical protein
MIKPLIVITALMTLIHTAPAASELPAVLPPYLQNPTAEGMTICFLAQGADQVRFAWSPEGQPAITNSTIASTPISGTPWTIWKARLAKLQPGTRYQYQVLYHLPAGDAATPAYHFRPLNPAAKSLRFAVFNDIHNHDDTLAALMRYVQPDDYEFSLLLGDMWTNPDASQGAGEVFRSLAAYLRLLNASEKPMVFVRGNHETIGTFSDKMACLFDLPNLDSAAGYIDQQWYFTLEAGPVWFVALDGGDDFIKRYELFQPYRQRQAEWLRGLVSQGAGAGAPWRILLTHMPLYNDNIWNSEPCRLAWEPVLTNASIDLEIGAHDHQWKQIGKGQTFDIQFNGHYPDQQDPLKRSHYSFTTPFPVLIGGGPNLKKGDDEGAVILVTADKETLHARWLAATDGRLLSEFTSTKGKPASPAPAVENGNTSKP